MRPRLNPSRQRSHSHLLFAAATAVVAGFSGRASAQNFVAGSSWNTAADWSTGHVPGASSTPLIAPSATNGFTVNYDYNGPAVRLNTLTVSTPGFVGFSEALVMASNSLSAIVEMVGLSTFETGQIFQSGGTNTVNFLVLGNAPLSTGTYVLSSSGTLASASISVGGVSTGPEGRGILEVAGGLLDTTSAGTLTVYNTPGSGFTLSGGVVNIGALNLSGNPNLLHWIGGTLNFINSGFIPIIDSVANGGNLGPALLLNTGQELTSAGGEIVGNNGTATLTQTSGANVVAGSLLLGTGPISNSNGNGTYNLSGAGSVSAGSESISATPNTTGFFNQSGGTNSISGALNVGTNSNSTATYILNGGMLTTPSVNLGGNNPLSAIMTVNGGTLNTGTGAITISNTANTQLNLFSGTINTSALNVNGTASLFNWTSGTLGLNTDITFDPSAGATTTSAAFGKSLTLGSSQTLIASSNETLGGGTAFTLNVNGGSNVVNGFLTVDSPSGASTFNLSNGGAVSANGSNGNSSEIIGNSGAGLFNQSGGTNNSNDEMDLGELSGSTGTYLLSGGTLAVGDFELLGFTGSGTFNQSGGLHTVGNELDIAASSGSKGTFNLSGGWVNTPSVFVGGSSGAPSNTPIGAGGTGVLIVSNTGVLNVGGTLTAFNTSGSGVTLSGGTINTAALNLNGTPSLFNWISGTLGLTAGVILDPVTGLTNTTSAAFGSSLTVGAGQTLNVTGGEVLGNSSTFSLTVNGGINNAGAVAVNGVNGSSTYTLANGGSLNTTGSGGTNGSEVVAFRGAGLFNQSGGTNSCGGDLVIGPGSDAHGTYLLSGGTVSAFNIDVGGEHVPIGEAGQSGAGIFNQTGGATIVGGNLNLGYNQESSGTYVLTGGMLSAPSIYVGGSSEGAGGGGLLTVSNTGQLSNVQLLQVYGSGRVNLDVPATTVGGLTISGNGIVNLNGTLTIQYFSLANDPIASVVGYLKSGYNGGTWTGTAGIISTSAAAGSPTLSLGYFDDTVSQGAGGPKEVVVKYTLAGDANLDGFVNFLDLVAVIQNFNKAGTDWAHGNFAYGASTNFNDLVAVVQNFNKTLPPPSGSAIELGGTTIPLVSGTDVQLPEPCGLGLALAGATGLLAARQRRTRAK